MSLSHNYNWLGIVKDEHKKNSETAKVLSDYLHGEADDLVKERLMKMDVQLPSI